MIPAPLQPIPRSNISPYGSRIQSPAFPPGWRWDEPLECTREGFLLPARRSMIEKVYLWIVRKMGWRQA